MSFKFELPERIKNTREYGQRYFDLQEKQNTTEITRENRESDTSVERCPEKSICGIYEKPNYNQDDVNTITVIGVTKENLEKVKKYFCSLTVDSPKFHVENVIENGLNWIYVTFSRDPSTIEGVKPVIYIDECNYIGCFNGFFGTPITERHSRKGLPVFRVLENNENMTYVVWEDKPWYVKIREFIFGEGEMRVIVKPTTI